MAQALPAPARRDRLTLIVRLLVAATITYNVTEAVIAIWAGTIASSTALIGFGLDSVVEVSSALAVAWQFSARDHEVREARERRALKVIAVSFFALAAYVVVEAGRDLLVGEKAGESVVGIALAAVSLAVMPVLALAKRRVGRRLGNPVVVADSTETALCSYLSLILLAGLILNGIAGWWWADPLAGLGIAALAVREGREAWRGESCAE
jgi:divalent metal cation (Fe/Co/Zn/Cd) transporter